MSRRETLLLGVLLVMGLWPADLRAQPAATTTTQPSSFLAAAREVTASIQRNYWDPKTGLYAGSTEDRNPDHMWGNGVMCSTLVAAARYEPRTYRVVLNRFFLAMDRYWDAKAKVPGYEPSPTSGNGRDKYYDDNAWMVLTFLEAYDLTRDARYLNRAEATLAFALSGWDDTLGGGIWWHEQHKAGTKNTCANAPTAVACLRLASYRDRATNLAWARKIVAWTNENLQDTDGRFFDNVHAQSGKVDPVKLTYNTALMLRANLALHRATGEQRFLDEAVRIGARCDAFLRKDGKAYRDPARFAHLLVEADLELHRATGDPRALQRARGNGEAAYAKWRQDPPKELIGQASIARMLWLLADQETDTGRTFWERVDGLASPSR
ncbi:MAG: glycoside hydrolase family 76 protein [Tepidisphaeraceae bacterium]